MEELTKEEINHLRDLVLSDMLNKNDVIKNSSILRKLDSYSLES
jgi:hypothetical protein